MYPELYPKRVLNPLPVAKELPEYLPKAVLPIDVVKLVKELTPIAVLLSPDVIASKAKAPTPTF